MELSFGFFEKCLTTESKLTQSRASVSSCALRKMMTIQIALQEVLVTIAKSIIA